ncbi:hypothetical protein XENOCAPTIV_016208, partial [Xenoophorus captivus]
GSNHIESEHHLASLHLVSHDPPGVPTPTLGTRDVEDCCLTQKKESCSSPTR